MTQTAFVFAPPGPGLRVRLTTQPADDAGADPRADRHAEHAAQVVHPAVRVAQGDPTLDHLGRLDEQ